jgi:hypothetical protein
MRVLRGYDPTRPSTLQKSAPVADGVVIMSGQAIQLNWNSTLTRFEWNLAGATGGTITAAATDPVYFANADAADPDVISADSLPALPCFGQFELQTGYFTGTSGFVHGVPLTVDTGTPGSLKVTTWGTGTAVVGIVSGIQGPTSGTPIDLMSPNNGSGYASYAPTDSSAVLVGGKMPVIQLATVFNAVNA